MQKPKVTTKVKRAPFIGGKPAWYGLYWQDDQWNYVTNGRDVISYITKEAALKGAEYEQAPDAK